MSYSNSAPEAAELTDLEAARLAYQLAWDRYLPIQARHHEQLAARRPPGKNTDIETEEAALHTTLRRIWTQLLADGMAEVESLRDVDIVRQLQEAGRKRARASHPAPQSTPGADASATR